jgi:broad specificity phosphatase PhoE
VLYYLSHPEVLIDPDVPVTDWGLSAVGRARIAAASDWPNDVTRVVSSAERKAKETAEIICVDNGLKAEVDIRLGEIDRSATGYVPHDRHEALADAFFANPEKSIEGWESARDAQKRTVTAVGEIMATGGTVLIVGHGGVGTLLWCHLMGLPVSRRYDQHPGGGCFYAVSAEALRPLHGWRRIEDR